MERSNVRNYISLQEIEANLRSLQTTRSIDDMYKPYVPPPTLNFNNQNTENGISQQNPNLAPMVSTTTLQNYENSAPRAPFSNFINTEQYGLSYPYTTTLRGSQQNQVFRQQNPNLAPMVSTTTLQNYENSAPIAPFSNIINTEQYGLSYPYTTTLRGSPQKEEFDPLACPNPRILSGQIIKQGGKCSSSESAQSRGDQANCSNFAAPEMHNEPYYNQDPSCAGYYWCPAYCGYPYQPTLDQCQQQYPTDLGIDFCCCPQSSNSLEQEAQVSGCRASDSQDTSCGFNCSEGCTDNEGSSKSLGSNTSKKSVCDSLENKYSDRALKMPDPEVRKVRVETASNSSCPGASSQTSSQSQCTEAGSTGECDPCFPQCPMDPCCPPPQPNCPDIEGFLRAQQQQTNQCCCRAYVNDVLQDQTVYSTDYRPIMGVYSPPIRQFPGGCCCQDMFLGGGFGACSDCPMSCGLNPCCPPPCDPNSYCYMPEPSCCPPSCEPSACCPPPCGPPSCCGAGLSGDLCGSHSTGIYGIGDPCCMSAPYCYPLSIPSPGYSGRPTVFH